MRLLILGIILIAGCAATPEPPRAVVKRAPPYRCPPLPYLPEDATKQEERLFNATVRELYAKCAESKR